MSRVGQRPIPVPGGTRVRIEEGSFVAEGPKGRVEEPLLAGLKVEIEDGVVTVARAGNGGPERARHGLQRSLLANAVEGVSEGFRKDLEIHGVGYRAEVRGREVHFQLGYSHPVVFAIPEGIEIAIDKSGRISVEGANKQVVGQVAAEIRGLRRPDPYKGKGVRYAGEVLRRKVGKAGAK